MAKVEATRSYGGAVELAGDSFEGAVAAAREHADSTGATLVHAYEDPRVIAGQGSIGLELHEHVPDVETVLIPVGGGGLAAGITIALRERRPGQRFRRWHFGHWSTRVLIDSRACLHHSDATDQTRGGTPRRHREFRRGSEWDPRCRRNTIELTR